VEGASTELLVRRVSESFIEAAGGPDKVRPVHVDLNKLKYIPCQACGEAPQEGWCLFEDDLTPVFTELASADAVIIGSPIYFDSVSGQAKTFIDRCNCFRPPDWQDRDPEHDFIKLLLRKRPGVMVLVGGERGWFEGARRVIAGWFRWVEVINEGVLVFRTADFHQKGTAAKDKESRAEADRLGRLLARRAIEMKTPA
jgi:NAD(P)H-dependent FMN reductase